MLLNLKISNLYSFNEEVEFSMIASKTAHHKDHVTASQNRYDPKILKSSIIYGANASGKSNLVKTLHFVKKLVTIGTKSDSMIPRKYFKLVKDNINKPSKIEIKYKYNSTIYIYGFTFNDDWILEEWLKEAGSTVEKIIFTRKTIKKANRYGKTEVEAKFKNITRKEKQFIEFIAEGTRPNQLFLAESRKRNVTQLFAPYNWFKDVLTVIFPDTTLSAIELMLKTDNDLSKLYDKYLSAFDTGINGIETKEMDIDNALPDLPEEIKEDLFNDLKSNRKSCAIIGDGTHKFSIYKNDSNELKALKLFTRHSISKSDEHVYFDIDEESDGVRRLLDLIPLLHQSTQNSRVFVIDEINRSLHPQITYKIIELFLKNAFGVDGQLIATTHELLLLTFDLFRKDEIWFIEKEKSGGSKLLSLDKYAPRFDKDILKEYLNGMYGGIPKIQTMLKGNTNFQDKALDAKYR